MAHRKDIAVYKKRGYRLRQKKHETGRLAGQTEFWIEKSNGERVAPDPQQVSYAPWYATPTKAWSNLLVGLMSCYPQRYTLDLNKAWELLQDFNPEERLEVVVAMTDVKPQEAASIIVTAWLKRK